MHKLRLASIAAAVAVLGFSNMGPAYAAGSYLNQETWVMASPSPSYGDYYKMILLAKNSKVSMQCWQPGTLALGQYKWFEIISGGVVGFVPAPAVSSQTSVRYCNM